MVVTDNTQLRRAKPLVSYKLPYMQTPSKLSDQGKCRVFLAKNHEKIGKNREDLNYREI